MKRCPKCGAVCPRPGQKFCSQCGAPLSETPPQASAGWPPATYVHRKRKIVVGVVVAVLLLVLLAAVIWGPTFVKAWKLIFTDFSSPDEVLPAVVTTETAPTEAPTGEDNRLYLENLTAVNGMKLTVNGVDTPYEVAEDGRVFLHRDEVTATDTLLRVIQPDGDGYRTALALVSKPSNATASFGTMTPCDAEGYNDPDQEYLDAMLSVYYRSQLQAFNSRQVADLRYSTQNNSQGWEGAITMGAYDAVEYDRDKSDMVFSTAGLTYGDHTVTLNAAGQWTGVNRKTGETESGTDYMTIEAIWQDGMWKIDRCIPCSEEEYNNGTLKISIN